METKQTTTNLSPSPNKGNTQRKLTFSLTNESQEYNALGYSKYTPLVRSDFDMSIIEKWIEVRASNAPKRRCQHSSFIYNNNLYVYGGVDIGEGRMNDLHRMNIENLEDLKWEEIKSSGASPEPVSGQSSIIVENKLYMFGGENSRQQATNNLYILDLDQLKWEKRIFIENDIPNMMGHTANYNHFDNSLIIFGGFAKGKYLNTVYSYSIEKLYWELNETAQTELPEGRIYHSAVLAEDALYIYGGVNIDGNYLGDMWKFDLVSKLWEKILPANKGEDDIPLPRCGHTMTYHPETNSIFIFGGKISNIQERNEFWKFDIKKNSFELMHDTLIEQHNDFNQTDNSFSHKNSFSRKRSTMLNTSSGVSQFPRSESQIIANRTSIVNSFNTRTLQNKNNSVKKNGGKIYKNNQKQKLNFEEMVLNSPNSKKMNVSLIYKTDLADSNTLRQRLSTLLTKTALAKEQFKTGVIPPPRDGHTAVLHNNTIIIFGGDRNKFPYNDLYIFNI